MTTKIVSINIGSKKLVDATPGGLLGVATKLDPALTKSDALAGQVAGLAGLAAAGPGQTAVQA